MPDEPGSSAPSSSGRKLLIAVDDSAECESALGRALRELYRCAALRCSAGACTGCC